MSTTSPESQLRLGSVFVCLWTRYKVVKKLNCEERKLSNIIVISPPLKIICFETFYENISFAFISGCTWREEYSEVCASASHCGRLLLLMVMFHSLRGVQHTSSSHL